MANSVRWQLSSSLAGTLAAALVSACTAWVPPNMSAVEAVVVAVNHHGFREVPGHEREIVLHRRGASDMRHYVFFEGDGALWPDQGAEPPRDPTPQASLALAMALGAPPGASVTYVGRECQFVLLDGSGQTDCPSTQWTSARYGPQYIERITATLRSLTSQQDKAQTYFVGHSGGGAVALLAAATLKPTCTVTLASPIDTKAWTDYHGWEPLDGSLNPAQVLSLIPNNRRIHYYGEQDRLVPIASSGFPESDKSFRVLPRVNHSRGWTDVWNQIKGDPCRHAPTDGG